MYKISELKKKKNIGFPEFEILFPISYTQKLWEGGDIEV